jgi:hypothetical protein
MIKNSIKTIRQINKKVNNPVNSKQKINNWIYNHFQGSFKQFYIQLILD